MPSTNVNPVLVELKHGDGIESRHRGIAIIIDADGTVQESWGDTSQIVCLRSAIKPIQALALIESGAFEALGLSDEQLTLACASHNGEPMHVERVHAWLARIGCDESDLACGPHGPSHRRSAEEFQSAGKIATRATNGCSGKHAGFLSIARHLGSPTSECCALEGPVQQRVLSSVAELADLDLGGLGSNLDFCNAPNLFAPFDRFALAFARMTDASKAGRHGPAAEKILDAIGRHPALLGGSDRFCSDLTLAAGPNLIAKSGAEGVYVVFLRRERRVILVKIDDGADRAAPVVCCALLERIGRLRPTARKMLRQYRYAPFLSSTGETIGVLKPNARLA